MLIAHRSASHPKSTPGASWEGAHVPSWTSPNSPIVSFCFSVLSHQLYLQDSPHGRRYNTARSHRRNPREPFIRLTWSASIYLALALPFLLLSNGPEVPFYFFSWFTTIIFYIESNARPFSACKLKENTLAENYLTTDSKRVGRALCLKGQNTKSDDDRFIAANPQLRARPRDGGKRSRPSAAPSTPTKQNQDYPPTPSLPAPLLPIFAAVFKPTV